MAKDTPDHLDPKDLNCTRCVRETTLGGKCPECGRPVAQMLLRPSPSPYSASQQVLIAVIIGLIVLGGCLVSGMVGVLPP